MGPTVTSSVRAAEAHTRAVAQHRARLHQILAQDASATGRLDAREAARAQLALLTEAALAHDAAATRLARSA